MFKGFVQQSRGLGRYTTVTSFGVEGSTGLFDDLPEAIEFL